MCSAPFFFIFPQIIIIFILIKNTFQHIQVDVCHNVWSSSCWCAVSLFLSLARFPLTTISFLSPFFSPLCAASVLTGKSTLLLLISKLGWRATTVSAKDVYQNCILSTGCAADAIYCIFFFKRWAYSLCLADTRRMGRSHFMPALSLAAG